MSGAGRKSGYRKSVTDGFLNELPLPEEGKSAVAQVGAPRGSNVFEVLLPDGSQSLALMPNKFKKLIWVKRNDFVIVSTTTLAPDTAVEAPQGDGRTGNELRAARTDVIN